MWVTATAGSAVDGGGEPGGEWRADEVESGEGFVDPLQVVPAEFKVGRGEVVVQVGQAGAAGDRDDLGLLGQEPGECDLRG